MRDWMTEYQLHQVEDFWSTSNYTFSNSSVCLFGQQQEIGPHNVSKLSVRSLFTFRYPFFYEQWTLISRSVILSPSLP